MELNSNAPSCTVRVAVCPHLGFKKDGSPQHPWTGQELKVMSLKKAINSQLNIKSTTPKGGSGCVFPFEYDKMYSIKDFEFYNAGVTFSDLDHLTDIETHSIIHSFDKLCQLLPDLVCMHLSYSGSGFHLYFLSPRLSKTEHEKRVLVNCLRLERALEVLGVPIHKAAFDSHQVSIKQRFFLNRPANNKIYWNDLAFSIASSPAKEDYMLEKEMPSFKDENPELYRKWLRTRPRKKTSVIKNVDYTSNILTPRQDIAPHLGHQERMKLFNSLRVMFKDDKDVVMSEWSKCMHRMEFTSAHTTQMKAALDEPYKNRWLEYDDPHESLWLLSKFYNINELKDTKCEDKPINVETNKEPALTDDEKLLLAKYM